MSSVIYTPLKVPYEKAAKVQSQRSEDKSDIKTQVKLPKIES